MLVLHEHSEQRSHSVVFYEINLIILTIEFYSFIVSELRQSKYIISDDCLVYW